MFNKTLSGLVKSPMVLFLYETKFNNFALANKDKYFTVLFLFVSMALLKSEILGVYGTNSDKTANNRFILCREANSVIV